MNSPKSLWFILVFGLLFTGLKAQEKNIRDSVITMSMLHVDYAPFVPGGDLASRFGTTHTIGGAFGRKFKHNFYLEGGVRMLFGSTVKQAVATNVATLAGNSVYGYLGVAIGNDGRQTTIRFQERGILIPVYFGKIFPLFKHLNPNSGIYVEGGIQYIQHRIWIEVPANNVAQLTRDMRKGYDRLCAGIGFLEGFGFRYFSNKRLVNFHIGVEISQNFTQPMRPVNYDTGKADTGMRNDLLWGIKVGWTVPIYQASPDKTYYY